MANKNLNEVLAEIEAKDIGNLTKAEWYKRFAYVRADDSYYDLIARKEISRKTFNAIYRHHDCISIHKADARIPASNCFDENRQAMGAKAIVGITYAAGESILLARNGDIFGNLWRNARPDNLVAGDVTRWLDHAKTLIPNEQELNHVLDVMAHKVQYPNIKINHAILHGGNEGSGKDTLYAPFIWAVCGDNLENRGLVDNNTLMGEWGYQLESEIMIINELKEPQALARKQLANHLKPIIAAPPEMLPINRKGLHPYMMLNRVFVMAFTNDEYPISLSAQDRRWFCLWSDMPRMDEDKASELWHWYQNEGGFSAIASWLMARDVSKFNPSAPPMMTPFKLNLIEFGNDDIDILIVNQIKHKLGDFNKGFVASPFTDICNKYSSNKLNRIITHEILERCLTKAGWIDQGSIQSSAYTSKKRIFTAPDFEFANKTELRAIVESETKFNAPRMILVK